jgi:hypothetical protein
VPIGQTRIAADHQMVRLAIEWRPFGIKTR